VGQYKIAKARLTPFGDGPTAPVAANTTEEGRAKNRRVELVAQ
jgi:outer membrane protein OmpA-like peptidoglycan-associated protein